MRARHWLGCVSVVVIIAGVALFWAGTESSDTGFWMRLGLHPYVGIMGAMLLTALGVAGAGFALVLELIHRLGERRR